MQLIDSQQFKIESYIPVIDQIIVSLNQRIDAYAIVENYYGFLRKLHDLSPEEIKVHALQLVRLYENDIEGSLAS